MKLNVQNIVQMKLNPILHDRRGPYEIGSKNTLIKRYVFGIVGY
jgi:hypothetical protein